MNSQRRTYAVAFLHLALLGLLQPVARSETLTYTLDSGSATMSGTLGSLSFTNATWFLTATADPAGVTQGGLDLGGLTIPAYFLPASVALTITDSVNGVTSMTLNNPVNAAWGVMSGDYGSLSPGISFLGFTAFSGSGSPWSSASLEWGIAYGGPYGGTAGSYNNLGTVGAWNGGNSAVGATQRTASTSLGTMTVTQTNNVTGTGVFSIAAVPEPSTCAMALAGLACGGYSMFRRRKRT
jgi:hypothetical protein